MKREIDPKAVSVRLIQRMKELDINGADITRATGATSAAITKWRQGINAPTRYILQLAKLLQTTPEWLLYGTPSTKQEPPAQMAEKPRRTSDIGEFGEYRLWSNNDPLPEDEYYYAPFYKDIAMMGGAGSTEMEDYNGFRLPFGKASLYRNGITPSNVSCCTLTGDSMEPVIPDGATIGIDQGETTIRDGKIYAFRHDDVYRVKRLYLLPGGKVRINSFNQDEPAYRDEIVSLAEIEIIGRVFNWSVMAP